MLCLTEGAHVRRLSPLHLRQSGGGSGGKASGYGGQTTGVQTEPPPTTNELGLVGPQPRLVHSL